MEWHWFSWAFLTDHQKLVSEGDTESLILNLTCGSAFAASANIQNILYCCFGLVISQLGSHAEDFAPDEFDEWTYYVPEDKDQREWGLCYVLLVKKVDDMLVRLVGLEKIF